VKDPREVVKAGELVKVKVIDVDLGRNRIALTMRLDDPVGERSADAPGGAVRRSARPEARPGPRPPSSAGHTRPAQRAREPQLDGPMAAAFAKLRGGR